MADGAEQPVYIEIGFMADRYGPEDHTAVEEMFITGKGQPREIGRADAVKNMVVFLLQTSCLRLSAICCLPLDEGVIT